MSENRDGTALPLSDEEIDAARGVYLSRLMFNQFVGWSPETRSFDEFLEAWKADSDE